MSDENAPQRTPAPVSSVPSANAGGGATSAGTEQSPSAGASGAVAAAEGSGPPESPSGDRPVRPGFRRRRGRHGGKGQRPRAAEGGGPEGVVEPTAGPAEEPSDLPTYSVSEAIGLDAGDPAKRHQRALPDEDLPKLHKLLADAGLGSRRDMEELIIAGRVSVNGQPAHVGQRIAPGDQVRVNGRPVRRPPTALPPKVLRYHKPSGEICTRDDPSRRSTVFERLPRLKGARWVAVGRLDFNTEGLLIFTTSGEIANQLMHPRYGWERESAVRILGRIDEEARSKLIDGVMLEDGPAAFSQVDDLGGDGANAWYRVVITEGRNREVRRMFDAVGLTVSRLARLRFGPVALPRGLARGRWIELPTADVVALQKL
ncbi:MAG: pseudouridine synthase, partial [Betaproteobacteria bacterium]